MLKVIPADKLYYPYFVTLADNSHADPVRFPPILQPVDIRLFAVLAGNLAAFADNYLVLVDRPGQVNFFQGDAFSEAG